VKMVYRFYKVICIDSSKAQFKRWNTQHPNGFSVFFYTFYIMILLTFKIRLVK
jgi:hypothetical protein